MKNEYMSVFTAAVKAKVEKANALGSKTSWTTSDHLETLSTVIYKATREILTGDDEEAKKDMWPEIRDILGECYNVSAFQQTLARAFKKTGHFQRETTQSRLGSTVSELQKIANG